MPEFVIFLRPAPGAPRPSPEDVRAHVDHIVRIEAEGRLVAAGPFSDPALGGMIVAIFAGPEEALRFAREDPFVVRGYRRPDVHGWFWSRRENGHLGVLPEK